MNPEKDYFDLLLEHASAQGRDTTYLQKIVAQIRRAYARRERRREKPKCRCTAYAFPHRPGGGLCRNDDPPASVWEGIAGKHRPPALRRRGLRKAVCRHYGLHPIRDRAKIERFLPKLYPFYHRSRGKPFSV